MQTVNPFDKKLKIWGDRIPEDVRTASTFVNDTLELCWASAQAIFQDKTTPEAALAIFDRVCPRTVSSAARAKGATQ